LYGHSLNVETPTIIVAEGAFHGRTLATLTATGNSKAKQGFTPLMPGFIRVPYNNIEAIVEIARCHNEVVAILIEPIQGEGGVNIPDANYLTKIRELCDKHNWLLLLDEIQTGIGRTGKWCAYQHTEIKPDVLTLAKGLGNGVPIGACLAQGRAAHLFQPGSHGSTFGGNPLVCRSALAVIETIQRDNLLTRVIQLANQFKKEFSQQLQGVSGVKDIRIQGLMIGIELDRPCGTLVNLALSRQLLINVTAERTIRLLPPLILSDEQANSIITLLSHLIREFLTDSSIN